MSLPLVCVSEPCVTIEFFASDCAGIKASTVAKLKPDKILKFFTISYPFFKKSVEVYKKNRQKAITRNDLGAIC